MDEQTGVCQAGHAPDSPAAAAALEMARLAPATQNEAKAAATVTAATAKAAKVIPAATPHSVKRLRQAPPRAARALAVWLANAPNRSASTSQERMRCAEVRGVVLTSSWPWCEQTQNSSRLSSWAYCYRACALCGACGHSDMAAPDLYADEELDSPHASAHHDAGFGSAVSFETQASVVRSSGCSSCVRIAQKHQRACVHARVWRSLAVAEGRFSSAADECCSSPASHCVTARVQRRKQTLPRRAPS